MDFHINIISVNNLIYTNVYEFVHTSYVITTSWQSYVFKTLCNYTIPLKFHIIRRATIYYNDYIIGGTHNYILKEKNIA